MSVSTKIRNHPRYKEWLQRIMSDTISPPSTRPTLKLKVGLRRSLEIKAPIPPPEKKSKLKPGARWSDEYTQRMQADMNALRMR